MASNDSIFLSIMNVLSPKEDKVIVERRKREENMRNIQNQLNNLKQGIVDFQNRKENLIKKMRKARNRGDNYEAENALVMYKACDDQLKKLNEMMKNLTGIQISMKGAEYSVGAMDIIQQSSEFYVSVGQSINPDSIDRNISSVMDQEIIISEMQEQLSSPFSKSSLEYSQKDDTVVFDEIDLIIGSSSDGGGPRDRPKTESMIELPTIPDDVKKQALKTKRKANKKKALKTKSLF